MQVGKWGNALAIRLPTAVVDALGSHDGDRIEIHVVGAHRFEVVCRPDRAMLLRRLRVFRGRLPADAYFDRDEANARDC